jgi:hypothetical protein
MSLWESNFIIDVLQKYSVQSMSPICFLFFLILSSPEFRLIKNNYDRERESMRGWKRKKKQSQTWIMFQRANTTPFQIWFPSITRDTDIWPDVWFSTSHTYARPDNDYKASIIKYYISIFFLQSIDNNRSRRKTSRFFSLHKKKNLSMCQTIKPDVYSLNVFVCACVSIWLRYRKKNIVFGFNMMIGIYASLL